MRCFQTFVQSQVFFLWSQIPFQVRLVQHASVINTFQLKAWRIDASLMSRQRIRMRERSLVQSVHLLRVKKCVLHTYVQNSGLMLCCSVLIYKRTSGPRTANARRGMFPSLYPFDVFCKCQQYFKLRAAYRLQNATTQCKSQFLAREYPCERDNLLSAFIFQF